MSNQDFEDRLSRIRASGSSQPTIQPRGPVTGGSRLGRIIGAVLVATAGASLARFANINYESIRDEYGILAALGLGLLSLALVVIGCVLLFRALFPGRDASRGPVQVGYTANAPQPQVQTSSGSRIFFSLLGLALGAIACLYLYIGNASTKLGTTGQVDAETAKAMSTGSALVAFLLVAVALLIGFIGLFVRRLPMRRVPIFFVLGVMLLYAGFQTLGIHPSNWPTFMAEFSRSFEGQLN